MRIRTHPGEVLREEFLKPYELSARELAEYLDVPANRLTDIMAERRSITADTAVRLSRFFGTTPVCVDRRTFCRQPSSRTRNLRSISTAITPAFRRQQVSPRRALSHNSKSYLITQTRLLLWIYRPAAYRCRIWPLS